MTVDSAPPPVAVSKGSSTSLDNVVGKDLHGSVEAQPKNKTSKTASYFNVLFSGFALVSDGYQSGVISFINLLLTAIYGSKIFNSTMSSRLSYALYVGAVIGQLGFGLIIDRLGRKIGLILTTALVILGAALSCASSGTTPTGLLWMMVISRGVLGVGVGGEYPCSSVSAGESADEVAPGKRGRVFVFVTNFVLALGSVIAAVVVIVLLAIFKDNLEPVWRLAFGLGIVPPLSVIYFRLKMADSKAYQKGAMKKKVPYWLIFKRYWPRILLTSGLWFIYDFISSPSGVFSTIIIQSASSGESLLETVAWNVLLYAFYLPGCIAGAFSVDGIGRRWTLALGWFLQGVVGMILGGTYGPLSSNCFPMFVIMYGIFLLLGQFGPGDCMGLNAMELFPTAVRGTGYGIAAAMGKVGAIVGTLAFKPMQEAMGVQGPFLVSSGIAIAASLVAFFFIPDVGPDYLAEQDAKFKDYLAENGYDISQLGLNPSANYNSTDTSETASVSPSPLK